MNIEFAGKGKRRPLIDIPIDKISLDIDNPRLARQRESVNEFDIIKTLYEEYDLEELALSMSENGYFDEEPIIVVPKQVPVIFQGDNKDSIEEIQKKLMELLKNGEIEFVVVEGNRRVSTAKILTNPTLRQKLKIREDSFAKPKSEEVVADISLIPAIVYWDRKEVAPYLGVRHITGMLKWDAYAKAAYIANNIAQEVASGKTINDSIKIIQDQIADRSDVIKKQFLCFKIMKEAEEDLEFDTKRIKNSFSLMTVALNSPAIRAYIGSPSYKEANYLERIIPVDKLEQLRHLLTWIFGDGKNEPILTDSRRITSELAPVLAKKEATEYLVKTNILEEAYERSSGEKDYIIRKVNSASSAIKFSLSYAWKYKQESELQLAVEECLLAIGELKRMMNSND
ncbi:MAG TPA: hypothetical protein VNB90_15225 [Cytophagaceae bacterium]|jgi:hypothetical protein|nr:hypothetical protein [Cytophagaceae bacterium]